ncbi:MAG TPA: N-acetylmuramoyl-L-alanine amidase, partial [Solirubrobacteraceae bacterium]|nr:N-acetylmuramoyl-L-alanine amidase [Solirubrobacteraceae bacterium]
MESPRGTELTRRTLLGGAVAAGAASVLGPAETLAAALGSPPDVFSRWVGLLHGTSGVLAAPRRFSLVGVEWDGPADARIELRTGTTNGRWSRWALASVLGHGPDGASTSTLHFGEPIWSGPADAVRLRSDVAIDGVRLHFVSADAPGAAVASAALPLVATGLEAGPGQPPIIARTAWGQGGAPPRFPPAYGSVKLAFIHHSEGPNGYRAGDVPAILASIYQFHRFVRGWNDIGYNFAIDAFGRIWEARAGGVDEPVIGAHAGGYNLASTGVVILGTFIGVLPPPAALAALERLLAWKLALHGVPAAGRVGVRVDADGAGFTRFAPGTLVSLPRVAGHRDGDQTACPGDALYARLPSIRPRVARLAGAPSRLSLLASPQELTAGGTVTLSGSLAVPGGASAGGAPIELQMVGRRGPAFGTATTVATATAAADGSWSATLAPVENMLVRALHRPTPATVSDVVLLAVEPAITLQVDSASPLAVSGTVSPPKRFVEVDLYA